MDGKMIVLVYTLFTMFVLKTRFTHATCQSDTNGLMRFGSSCKHMCHCKNVTEKCYDKDGTCTTSGCANAWMGPGCQYRDITSMEKSQHSSNIIKHQYSERAIDGNITTCSRTSKTDNKPWWRLWLSRQELIKGLVLVTETDKLANFKEFNITVEEDSRTPTTPSPYASTRQLCYTYPNMTPLSNTIEVTCDQPLVGNQVRIKLDGSSTQLVICDIRIYGGKNVAFGKQTNQSSYYAGTSSNSSVTVDGVIEYSSNKCSSTQQENHPWWSVDLNYIMSIQAVHIFILTNGLTNFQLHARNDSRDNWTTVYDDSMYYTSIKYITLVVHTRYLRLYSMGKATLQICEVQVFGECNASRWGLGCDNLCGNCLNAGPCSVQTGHCPQGCKYGYKHTTACESVCDDGTYGSNCSQICVNCKENATCQKDSGRCPNGCAPGWRGQTCEERCLPGFYGENCIQNCSNHCKDGYKNCNNVNGICEQLCETGWKGELCDQECANRSFGENCLQPCGQCLHGPCDRVSGNCTGGCMVGYRYTTLCVDECVSGTFGDNCSQNCSNNCKGGYGSCNKIDGTCEQLCEAGWTGVLCNQECDNGKFGENCLQLCGQCLNDPCERVSGNCTGGCMAGYKNTTRCVDISELSASPDSPVTAIVGGVVAAIVVIVAVLVVLLFLRYRRNNGNQKPSTIFSGDLTDASRDVSDTDIDAVETARSKPSTSKRENIYMNSDVFVSLRNTYDTDNNKPGTSIIKSSLQSDVAVADNGNDSDYYNTSVQRDIPKGAIWLSNLRKYIGENTSQDDIFHEQFISLPKGLMHPTTVALKPRNRPKNRYKELYAYDHSRVVLQQIPGKRDSDYINAAFINGHNMEKAYIAAQGPTNVNIFDFWRMIWEKDVTKIVMVTNVVEEGKDKCEQYWNSEEQNCYDSLSVTVTSEEVMAEFTIRTFSVKSIPQNKQRTITHYQFTGWPDKSIPNGHTCLVQFWSKVRMDDKESAHPWLVHCSAGVGRTGTFIALDILYEQGIQLEYVNVNQCVRELRQQRVNMVQTQSQYRYLHEIVYEALVLPSLQIRLSDFENEYRKLIEVDKQTGMTCIMSQFEMQEEVVHHSKKDIDEKEHSDDVVLYTTAKLPENKVKNRYNNILASDKYRPFLSTHVPGCNDYINAVYIPSYRKLRGFIVSQAPLENTAIDCCRLVHERDIHVIVTFADNGTEKIGTYLPDKGSLTTGHFHLELVSEEKRRNYTIRNYNMQFKKKEQNVKQLLFTQWLREETVPRDQEAILSLIQEVTEQQRQSDNNPILVQCLNGAERSGMFVVLMNVLERMRLEQEVAIPPVIRNLRQIRQQIIPNFEQYKFCHEAVLRHIQDTSTYANV